MSLSTVQQQEFYDKGYIKVAGVVPRELVDTALRAINHSMGQGMNESDMPILRAQSYCPEIRNTPVISDLVNRTALWNMAEAMVGEGNLNPVGGGQIALRFPARPGAEYSAPHPHLDGMYSPTNGVPQGEIHNFTLLIGVLLSDLPQPNAGNFTAWPGTHHLFEKYFRQHGPDSFLNGLPSVELPQPEQITGRAGDAILCHYQVAHGIAPQLAPHIRYASFFRLKHCDHDSRRREVLSDIWLDYEGMESFSASCAV